MLRLNLTLHVHMNQPAYSFRETDDELPDEDELYELSLIDTDIIDADRLHDMKLYNMAYTDNTDTEEFDIVKFIRNI